MSYEKIKNESCGLCNGSGQVSGPTTNDFMERDCSSCDGLGYRVLYRDENGHEFNCTINEWKWRKDL